MTRHTTTERNPKTGRYQTRTLAQVYDAVLDVKETVLEVKTDMLALKEHVNDRNEAIEEHIELIKTQIDGKLGADQLLTSLGFKLLNNKWARWTVGVVGFTVVSTILTSQWYPILKHAINTLP